MIRLKSLITEASPADQAKKMGLKSIGFGRYVDPSDPHTVVAKSKGGKLVKVKPDGSIVKGTVQLRKMFDTSDPEQMFDDSIGPQVVDQWTQDKQFPHKLAKAFNTHELEKLAKQAQANSREAGNDGDKDYYQAMVGLDGLFARALELGGKQ